MSRFYFGGSESESGDEDALPYPQPLARTAFLTPDFSPTAFLSSLQNRHQTLEDLRAELRARSQQLSTELLDLVNENYQDFLGLGASVTGGDEKIESVRVGLLSFQRDVEGLRSKATARRIEVEALLAAKRRVAGQIRAARALLEVDARLEELERALAIAAPDAEDDESEESVSISESEESDDDEVGTVSVSKLRHRVQRFMNVKRLMTKLGDDHSFLDHQQDRSRKIRETLLLDLSTALAESKQPNRPQGGVMKVLALYRILEEPHEAVRALKGSK